MEKPLTLEEIQTLVSHHFVYQMPFNQLIGLELIRFLPDYAEIQFQYQEKLIGNTAQRILHGGMIASVLDVTAGLVCVGNALTRLAPITQEHLQQKLAKMGTIDLRVDYLRPGRGERFIASGHILRGGNKVSVARVELHNESKVHIASATATYLVG